MVVVRLHHARCVMPRCALASLTNNASFCGVTRSNQARTVIGRNFTSNNTLQRQASNDGGSKIFSLAPQSSRIASNKNSAAGYYNSHSDQLTNLSNHSDDSFRDSSSQFYSQREPSKSHQRVKQQEKPPKRPTLIKYQDVESSIYNHFYYHYYHSQNNPVYRENMPYKTKIPVLDASPLFDPALYCRKSALRSGDASISGTAAAKRLRQGKQLAVDLLQHDLCNWAPASKMRYYDDYSEKDPISQSSAIQEKHQEHEEDTKTLKVKSPPWTREGGVSLLQTYPENEEKNNDETKKNKKQNIKNENKTGDVENASNRHHHRKRKSKAFVLEGHGVPFQLFQDHIDLCDSILSRHGGATECSFNNFDGKLTVDWMRIRGKDGKNFASPWPPRYSVFGNDCEEFELRLQLYLSVMNRLSSTFGKVLDPNPDHSHHIVNPIPQSGDSLKDEDDEATETFRPRHWNVQFLRGMAYPSNIIPSPKKLSPIVELTQREGIVAPRNVRIVVQSVPSSRGDNLNGDGPVTLVFDACFSKTLLRR